MKSAHNPFTHQNNETGIVHPKKVFEAIKESYDAANEDGMPPKVSEIYLAFELFFGVMDTQEDIIKAMRESVGFWRQYLPRDGMTLDELV